jgi:Cys-rich repeat protein
VRLAFVLLLLPACSLAPAAVECASDGDCATGFVCVELDGLARCAAPVGEGDVFHQNSDYPPRPDFWRIRHDGSNIHYESYNGSTWDQEAQSALPPFAVSSVRIEFGVESAASSAGIGMGGINTSPP